MKILYVGDIMGQAGMDTVQAVLPDLRREEKIDLVIAQAENVTDGKSMSLADMLVLRRIGIDFFTGGNHTPKRDELHAALRDSSQPVIGPANMHDSPGLGYKTVGTAHGQVLVISLLGSTVGNHIPETDNPLKTIDTILHKTDDQRFDAIVVNFHGDYSSEKRIIGYYLDGRVTMVVGDHWHVPTADAAILPKGTAHITDVGMCGSLHSSLGVSLDSVVRRWRDSEQTKNTLDNEKPWQFNALLVTTDSQTGLAKSAEHIQHIIQ